MKNAVTRNMADPILAVAPVIPTDTLNTTSEYEIGTVDELIAAAMRDRPEIATARLTLTNNIITKKSLRNELLPTLDCMPFTAPQRWPGLQTIYAPAQRRCAVPGFPTSYAGAFGNLFNSRAPDKGVGVNLTIPLRNRQVQADQVRNDLEYRQAQLSPAADREHDSAASSSGAVCVDAKLGGAAGGDLGPRLCGRGPGRRAEEAAHGSFDQYAGAAGLEQFNASRVQRAGGGHQLRKVQSAA